MLGRGGRCWYLAAKVREAAAAARCCFARAASSRIRASAACRLEVLDVPMPKGAPADGARIGAEAGRDVAARLTNADEPYIEEPRTAEPAGAPLDIFGAFKAAFPFVRSDRHLPPDRGAKHGTSSSLPFTHKKM